MSNKEFSLPEFDLFSKTLENSECFILMHNLGLLLCQLCHRFVTVLYVPCTP